MKKIVLASAVLTVAMSGFSVYAEDGHDHTNMKSEKGSMMDAQKSDMPNVGNKICPVSGEEIGAMGDVYTVEHEGKIYNLCCKMCAADFKKNPEEYIEKINEELENAEHDTNSSHDHGSH